MGPRNQSRERSPRPLSPIGAFSTAYRRYSYSTGFGGRPSIFRKPRSGDIPLATGFSRWWRYSRDRSAVGTTDLASLRHFIFVRSIPEMPFVVLNLVLQQKTTQFILKCHTPM